LVDQSRNRQRVDTFYLPKGPNAAV